MDFIESCVEEIALEGLDGITLSALWLRLDARQPKFPLCLDSNSKQYLWQGVIAGNPDLEFYELPEPRSPLVLFDRYKHTDPETGIVLEQESAPDDIYPFTIVKEQADRGSCASYFSRKKVSQCIRDVDDCVQMSLDEAVERWGESLVVVASQEVRSRTLYGPELDPDLELPSRIYCVLERVGRSRYQGEVTHGKLSLKTAMQDDPKTIFYIRKMLLRYGLITVQMFNQRVTRGLNVSGKLLHLKRFFVERKPMYLRWLETLTHKLQERPNQSEIMVNIREEMNMKDKTFKKLYQLGCKYVKTSLVPYREVYPNSTEQEYLCKNKMSQRFLRMLVLIKPFTYKVGCMLADDDDDDDEVRGVADDDDEAAAAARLEADAAPLVRELPLLHQIYKYAASRGEAGVTQLEVLTKFGWAGVGKLESRQLCRNLERLKVLKKILQDQGKQRVQKFVAVKHHHQSSLHLNLEGEKHKMRQCFGAAEEKSDEKLKPEEIEALDENILNLFGDIDEVKPTYQHQSKRNAHITYRMLRRANLIIDAVKEAKVIDNLVMIQKRIDQMEMSETGKKMKVDKKSVKRLVERLAKQGHIKSVKTLIKFGDTEKELHFLCDASLSVDDPLVKSAIDAAKHKNSAVSKEITKQMMGCKKAEQTEADQDVSDLAQSTICNYSLLGSLVKSGEMEYDSEAGKRYGFLPRKKRMQVVHQLLWYLVHGYGKPVDIPGGASVIGSPKLDLKGVTGGDKSDPAGSDRMEDDQPGVSDGGDELSGLQVYCDELDWRRFIPPLPSHYKTTNYSKGWCLIGDVLLVLPVSIFCQIVRVNFRIKGLEEYLLDPVKRNIIISSLPAQMRQQLLHERKYIFAFYDICTYLCLLGLLSFGKREYKVKEQIFIHMHKNCSIIDTSSPHMMAEERPVKRFRLNKFSDVNDYWFTLQWICLNTPFENITIPQPGIAQALSKTTLKPERFKTALEGRGPNDIVDDGRLPGDQKGAAGLDSSFFAHLRRNWTYNCDMDLKVGSLLDMQRLRGTTGSLGPTRQKRKDQPVTLKTAKPHRNFPGTGFGSRKKGRGGKTSTVSAAAAETHVTVQGPAKKGGKGIKRKPVNAPVEEEEKKRKRARSGSESGRKIKDKPVNPKNCDEVDMAALGRMRKERVEWTEQECSLLLLCQVTHEFLLWPQTRRDFILSWYDIRNILHEESDESLDKTSKACQRRVKYMMKNKRTALNVKMFVGEALQDKKLSDEFKRGKIIDKSHPCSKEVVAIFRNCLFKLRDKFGSNVGQQTFLLPDTVQELYSKYHVTKAQPPASTAPQDVTSDRDIYFSVLHNLIQSAMLLRDKTGRAHELYQLFSQYPEDLLLAVFTSMKNDGIITKIKKHEKRRVKMNCIPSMQMGTYQVAQRYMYKWVFSNYPNSIFQQTCQTLHNLLEERDVDTPGQALVMADKGGFCSAVVSLMAHRQINFETIIPEQIILVESQGTAETPVKRKARKTKPLDQEPDSDEEEEQLIAEAGDDLKGEVQSEATQPQTPPKPSESRVLFTHGPGTVSRSALTMMRNEGCTGAPTSTRMVSPQDNIVINSCAVKMRLKQGTEGGSLEDLAWSYQWISHSLIGSWNHSSLCLHPKTCFQLLRSLRALQPAKLSLPHVLEVCQSQHQATDLDLELMTSVHAEVTKSKSTGMTQYQIEAAFQHHKNFHQCLRLLLEHKVNWIAILFNAIKTQDK